jgi:hypothetical protein
MLALEIEMPCYVCGNQNADVFKAYFYNGRYFCCKKCYEEYKEEERRMEERA